MGGGGGGEATKKISAFSIFTTKLIIELDKVTEMPAETYHRPEYIFEMTPNVGWLCVTNSLISFFGVVRIFFRAPDNNTQTERKRPEN